MAILLGRLHPDEITALQHIGWLARIRPHAVGAQVRARPAHGFPGDGGAVTVTQQDADRIRAHLADDGRAQAAHAALGGEQFGQLFGGGIGMARFRAAVAVALVIDHQAGAQGVVGQGLQATVDRGVDMIAVDISVGAEPLEHLQARHLGDIGRLHLGVGTMVASGDGRSDRFVIGGLVDAAQVQHALQNPVAPDPGPLGVGDGVVGGGRLGQPGDHRQVRQRQLGNRLAIVDVGRRLDAVGAIAEVDLVHVQLEDLALAQVAFDLQCQQNLVQLAREHPITAEEIVLRYLHGDGAAAGLNLPGAQQLGRGPQQTHGVHPMVVEEIVILGGQDGVDEALGNLLETDWQAPHLAEFGDQFAVCAVNAQRSLQFDITQCIYVW